MESDSILPCAKNNQYFTEKYTIIGFECVIMCVLVFVEAVDSYKNNLLINYVILLSTFNSSLVEINDNGYKNSSFVWLVRYLLI